MSTVALELKQLSAGYASTPVVRGIDLHVNAGEVVALLGANGAGKTTTLRTISGLLPTIEGSLFALGRELRGMPPHRIARLGVAHVPEGRGLFPSLSVQENLRLGMQRGSSLTDAVRWFPQLEALKRRQAGLLSGGEQQMLVLARALVSTPHVLMVDEMSLGLAPRVIQMLLPTLRQYAIATGAAVLVVEQHVSLALAVADRAYLLRRGRVVASGSARELAQSQLLVRAGYLGDHGTDHERFVSGAVAAGTDGGPAEGSCT